MFVYRVLPYLSAAVDGAPGHPLFVPTSAGAGRVDNPDRYNVLYVGDAAAGAVAEAFGWATRWDVGLLRGSPSLPTSVRALATYHLPDQTATCNLDDAHRLVALALRPSDVVTRDRPVSQAWARRIHSQHSFAGIRWWSYYDSRWGSYGLWDTSGLAVADVTVLDLDHPAVLEAAGTLLRFVAP